MTAKPPRRRMAAATDHPLKELRHGLVMGQARSEDGRPAIAVTFDGGGPYVSIASREQGEAIIKDLRRLMNLTFGVVQ